MISEQKLQLIFYKVGNEPMPTLIFMSLATYIGTNVEIPTVNELEDYDQSFFVGDCFTSDHNKKNVMKYHFTTTYIYEVSSHWGIEIFFCY